eukprot:TRINITY_DN1988_c1_g2_i1.p1 TRINITY_DN1988_c1_g2~~TRINITY_DN1988_c1_g2_i1.p1  ORF type:complete len:290 (-),score=103.80 TRINITY_DN1988_c1_g2_i1:203-1072(-)
MATEEKIKITNALMGYEVCMRLNRLKKPCQRIGICPFHWKKTSLEKVAVPIKRDRSQLDQEAERALHEKNAKTRRKYKYTFANLSKTLYPPNSSTSTTPLDSPLSSPLLPVPLPPSINNVVPPSHLHYVPFNSEPPLMVPSFPVRTPVIPPPLPPPSFPLPSSPRFHLPLSPPTSHPTVSSPPLPSIFPQYNPNSQIKTEEESSESDEKKVKLKRKVKVKLEEVAEDVESLKKPRYEHSLPPIFPQYSPNSLPQIFQNFNPPPPLPTNYNQSPHQPLLPSTPSQYQPWG